MNKTEYRKHCEEQIERCIKLHDNKHLREHELSLALLNECEGRKKKEENLIKYLEDKIDEFKKYKEMKYLHDELRNIDVAIYDERIKSYQDILERLKKNNYE